MMVKMHDLVLDVNPRDDSDHQRDDSDHQITLKDKCSKTNLDQNPPGQIGMADPNSTLLTVF